MTVGLGAAARAPARPAEQEIDDRVVVGGELDQQGAAGAPAISGTTAGRSRNSTTIVGTCAQTARIRWRSTDGNSSEPAWKNASNPPGWGS